MFLVWEPNRKTKSGTHFGIYSEFQNVSPKLHLRLVSDLVTRPRFQKTMRLAGDPACSDGERCALHEPVNSGGVAEGIEFHKDLGNALVIHGTFKRVQS